MPPNVTILKKEAQKIIEEEVDKLIVKSYDDVFWDKTKEKKKSSWLEEIEKIMW